MTGSLVFPTRLFAPSSLQARLVGQAITGGVSLSGEAQFADASGGGRWVVEFGETALWTREKVLAWRAFVAACDGGAQSLLMPFADRRHQPVNPTYSGSDTFGLSSWVADAAAWTPEEAWGVISAGAALGATSLTMASFHASRRLLGGEKFSPEPGTLGWRAHTVTRVISGGLGSGDSTQIQFRPPLREAIPVESPGSLLNFESPRCVVRADGDLSETLAQLRFGKAAARFVEIGGAP
jgi:hypothetical protein